MWAGSGRIVSQQEEAATRGFVSWLGGCPDADAAAWIRGGTSHSLARALVCVPASTRRHL